MKWRSHLRIAEWVGSNLSFGKENILKLAEGSIAPDKWRDHPYHHNSQYVDKVIRERILISRKLFLKGYTKYFFEIGVALHYIVDRLIPQVSYPMHLNIEEELAKISKSKKESKSQKYSEDAKKHAAEIKLAIQELKIDDEEKTLLLDPTWTKGRSNTLKLALTDLPKLVDPDLLLNIASRISIGVTASIISRDPPPQLLWEKFKYASDSISRAIPKFGLYLMLEIGSPLLFLTYRRIGVLGYFLITLLNLLSLTPIILILKKKTPIKNYLRLRANSTTLFIFFLLVSLPVIIAEIFNFKFLLAGGVLVLIALLHLCYPRVPFPEEVEEEIEWYRWEETNA